MKSNKLRILTAALLVLTLALSGCGKAPTAPASSAAPSAAASQAPTAAISFTDIAGRQITLSKRPETFVVANYIANFLMVGGAESLDKVVGMTFDGWEDTRYGEYTAFTQAFPRMKGGENGIASVGGYHDDVLNAEKILSLRPDILLMNRSQFTENNQNIPVFEQAGIAVAVLDYHAETLENHTKSTAILGLLLGREDVAAAQNDAYRSAIESVQAKIAALPDSEKKRRVYVELGNKGVGEYGNSYGNTMLWGAILDSLGADNIASGVDGYGPLDRELVISADPQVILIGGSIWSGDTSSDQMRMGFTIDEATAQSRLAAFAARPAWRELSAVKTGEIYGIDHGSLRNMIDYTFTEYIAKILYPDLFADLDPQATMNAYYAKYLPELDASGTFMIKLAR